MLKLSGLKFVGFDRWDHLVFKSETNKYYCAQILSIDRYSSTTEIEIEIAALFKSVAAGREHLYTKSDFDSDPGFPVSLKTPLTTAQIQDLFEYIVTYGHNTRCTARPDIVTGAIPFDYDCGGVDSYTVYLDIHTKLPLAASDNLVGVHWILK